ncbi:hypothetical protein RAN53_00550 [Halomonas sp. SSL-5]|uniref:hypothetical protein n=1 Tax=Halomonas sp. SSL-5 TaxID=3065855 RepID=UPI0027388D7C|nr:hypothetical protein [Halomonas sp. SSL-5]MDY7114824.1 hypothetical protein [Halomonas sp. SSL-5]
MITLDLTLYGAGASDLAHHLRAVAERIESLGDAAIPQPGEERPVRINDALVGAITVPERLSLESADNLASAERVGNLLPACSHTALLALVGVPRDHGLPLMRYRRLLEAVDILAVGLGERADFQRDKAEEGGDDV